MKLDGHDWGDTLVYCPRRMRIFVITTRGRCHCGEGRPS